MKVKVRINYHSSKGDHFHTYAFHVHEESSGKLWECSPKLQEHRWNQKNKWLCLATKSFLGYVV